MQYCRIAGKVSILKVFHTFHRVFHIAAAKTAFFSAGIVVNRVFLLVLPIKWVWKTPDCQRKVIKHLVIILQCQPHLFTKFNIFFDRV